MLFDRVDSYAVHRPDFGNIHANERRIRRGYSDFRFRREPIALAQYRERGFVAAFEQHAHGDAERFGRNIGAADIEEKAVFGFDFDG